MKKKPFKAGIMTPAAVAAFASRSDKTDQFLITPGEKYIYFTHI